MKRWIWLALAAVGVVGAGLTLVAVPVEQEWTTSSPEALAEFELAMDTENKLYYDDAYRHITRAVELDPDFVIAKLWSISPMYRYYWDNVNPESVLEEVLAADTSKLTPRERYSIEHTRLVVAERRDEADLLLDEYLAAYPNDPYIVNEKASQHWSRDDFKDAERMYRRLVEIAPNKVIAYNQLGYIFMSQGRFAEAEENFRRYLFVAPDQANPHDSLGELFIALGRNDEAEASFEKAIEIKPDFWAAYNHIALMKSFNNDVDGAREILDRAKSAGIPDSWVTEMDCLAQYMDLRYSASWEEILELAETSKCVEKPEINFMKLTTHLAACEVGDWDTALEIERGGEEMLAKIESEDGKGRRVEILRAAIEHLQGTRLALQGNYGEAEELLRAADQRLSYIEASSAIFKLYNRMVLAELLLADGQDAEAHGLLTKIRGVNPLWVAEFQDSGFKMIGLERG